MASVYSLNNTYLSIAWTILGLINAIFLLVKQSNGNINKHI